MVNVNVTFTISSAPAISGTFTPTPGLVAPVLPGTILGTIAIQPAGWIGGLALTGPDAASLQIGGVAPNYTVVAGATLLAGSYSDTVVPTP